MCGINGIVFFDDVPTEYLHERLGIMLELTKHRGPDGRYAAYPPRAGLGVNRLAIMGLNEPSGIYSQHEAERYMLFNGEITNYRILRNRLMSPPADDRSDGAVILPMLEEMGSQFIQELAGMFAIAVYEASINRLQLWRDPLGIKPLYYCRTPNSVVFSSELKAVRAVLDIPPQVDFAAIDHILQFRFHPGCSTPFPTIQRVLPGETIIFESDKTIKRFFWKVLPEAIDDTNISLSKDEFLDEFRTLFTQVVAENCQADVAGGFFVSGGMDSSAITAVALRNRSSYKTALSIRFAPEPTVDEKFGQEFQDALGLPFEWVTITDADARQTLERIVYFMDEPLENPIHVGTYLMAKRAKELGVKTVLTGDGSDEFFLGYERHACWFNPNVSDPPSEYAKWIWALSPTQIQELYTQDALTLTEQATTIADQPIEPFHSLAHVLAFEQRDRLPEYHCMRLDRMTMACGVEARVPFLDHRIVEFAQRIPLSLRFGQSGKDWLRQATEPWLSNSIRMRPKTHFPSLPDRWLAGEGISWASEILLDPGAYTQAWFNRSTLERWLRDHQTDRPRYGRTLWACLALELWLRQDWVQRARLQ